MKKKIVRAVCALLALVLILTGSFAVLSFKYRDSTQRLKAFYALEDNTVDVLVLGTSHAYEGINTAVLWRKYGISAFDLCGAAQNMANTYYYLEEALKTQKPKVILLDTFSLTYTPDYTTTEYAIKNTYGLKWSSTRIDAIKNSFDTEKYGNQFLFTPLQSHTRYSDLSRSDFLPYLGNRNLNEYFKGFYTYFDTQPLEFPDYDSQPETGFLTNKNAKYFAKIIHLAKSNNIPLVCTLIPYLAEFHEMKKIRAAKNIAAGAGVKFYDFINDYYDDVGFDAQTDFVDKRHVNYLGSTKLSEYLGDILVNEYDVPDRRGDKTYESWQLDSNVFYNELTNYRLSQAATFEDYLSILLDNQDRYVSMITVNDFDQNQIKKPSYHNTELFLRLVGVQYASWKDNGGGWLLENNTLTAVDPTQKDYVLSKNLPNRHDMYIQKGLSSGGVERCMVYYDGVNMTYDGGGLSVCVFDTFTQEIVDVLNYSYFHGKITHVDLSAVKE